MNEKKCNKCGIAKPLDDFYEHTSHGKILPHSECKTCTLELNKLNRKKIIEGNTNEHIRQVELDKPFKMCLTCHLTKPIKEFSIRRSDKDGHSDYCRECSSNQKKLKHHNHKLLPKEQYEQWRLDENKKNRVEKQRVKYEVFSHYCKDGIVKCANPYHIHIDEMTDLDVLTLDHINGDGYKEPKNRRGGIMLYRKLKQHNYPIGFQILCANCQFKKKVINNEYGEFSGKVKPLTKSPDD